MTKTYRIVFADNSDSQAVDAIATSAQGSWSNSVPRFDGEHDLAFVEVADDNADYLESILDADENVISYTERNAYQGQEQKTYKISIGDSTRGYDSASVSKTKDGKYRLIPGTMSGRKTWIRKSIASINRGDNTYVTSAGDCLQISISNV
jgi:hypothetical protein